MIYDSIANLKLYGSLFDEVRAFIETNDIAALAAGRYEVADGIRVDIQDYTTKPKSNNVCEVHRKYIDLQYIVGGAEKMGFGLYIENEPVLPYNEEKDVAHHCAGHTTDCLVSGGWFCVFFPGEFHKPGLCVSEPMPVRKALFKIDGSRAGL